MASLTLTARIECQPDSVSFVKEELLKMVKATRIEDGCLFYDLHQDNDEPHVFIFYESWATTEAWMTHDVSEHVTAFKQATEGLLCGIILNKLTKL